MHDFVNGELSAADFVSDYANFYHYEALDGHEASSAKDAEARTTFWTSIDLHRRIQEEVVNRIAFDPGYSRETLKDAGRIDELDARERARAICAEMGIDAVIECLESG